MSQVKEWRVAIGVFKYELSGGCQPFAGKKISQREDQEEIGPGVGDRRLKSATILG
jgi:hypothetical protein